MQFFWSLGSTQFGNSLMIFKINNLIILTCILYFTTVGECSITFNLPTNYLVI